MDTVMQERQPSKKSIQEFEEDNRGRKELDLCHS